MNLRLALVVSFLVLGLCLTRADKPARPLPRIERVLIISIDGLRPDCLLLADTPTLHGLMHKGSYTMWARTTIQSITLPSHVSMLTGVTVEAHGITWNGEMPFKQPVYPSRPTLFEIAHKAGYTTGMAAGKDKFDIFEKDDCLDHAWVTNKSVTTDQDVADHATKIIKANKPEVMFVHFPAVDSAGHSKGWGSHEQLEAIAKADGCVKQVLDADQDAGLLDSTLVIISADHGGTGRSHGPEDVRSRMIPWIASGPGVKPFYDLTLLGKNVDIQTFDTFATACYVLGLTTEKSIDGKPVTQMFEDQTAASPTTQPTVNGAH